MLQLVFLKSMVKGQYFAKLRFEGDQMMILLKMMNSFRESIAQGYILILLFVRYIDKFGETRC